MPEVSLLRTFGNPLVWVLTIPYFAFYTVALGYALWAPTLVRDALKASNATTGLVVGGLYAIAILVYFLAGMLSDRKDERCAVAALGLALACAGCIGAALIAPSPLRVAAFADFYERMRASSVDVSTPSITRSQLVKAKAFARDQEPPSQELRP